MKSRPRERTIVIKDGKEINTRVSLPINMLQQDIPTEKMDKTKNVEYKGLKISNTLITCELMIQENTSKINKIAFEVPILHQNPLMKLWNVSQIKTPQVLKWEGGCQILMFVEYRRILRILFSTIRWHVIGVYRRPLSIIFFP